MHTQHPRQSHAFTLIELLVVISIITVLLALSLPSLGQARATALELKCKVNQKTLSLAMASYSADDRRKVVQPFGYGGTSSGPSAAYRLYLLDIYLGYDRYTPTQTRVKSKAWDCPVNRAPWQPDAEGGVLQTALPQRISNWMVASQGNFSSLRIITVEKMLDPHLKIQLAEILASYSSAGINHYGVKTYDGGFFHSGLRNNTLFADGHSESLPLEHLAYASTANAIRRHWNAYDRY